MSERPITDREYGERILEISRRVRAQPYNPKHVRISTPVPPEFREIAPADDFKARAAGDVPAKQPDDDLPF